MGKGGLEKPPWLQPLLPTAHRAPVHLSTTDPAATSLLPYNNSGLRVSRIDPVVEVRKYSEEVLLAQGRLDAGDARPKTVLPALKGAVFRAFASTVAEEWFRGTHSAPPGTPSSVGCSGSLPPWCRPLG
jgi:hypothetical protein